ncbi:hypothetical protein [Rappaport israeli]|uniref:hypothetical protein n=1 Tax=Rappaport israeli TaxID=1839807 RepID=UPI000A6DE744|nr:hypothetical protein [Rappaport israeli]
MYDRWSDTPDVPQTVNVGFPVTEVRTGWLDDYLIAGGVEALTIRPLMTLRRGRISILAMMRIFGVFG